MIQPPADNSCCNQNDEEDDIRQTGQATIQTTVFIHFNLISSGCCWNVD